jgi:hypothetical protein
VLATIVELQQQRKLKAKKTPIYNTHDSHICFWNKPLVNNIFVVFGWLVGWLVTWFVCATNGNHYKKKHEQGSKQSNYLGKE